MPELPEVQTTVDGLNRTVRGKVIKSVWLDEATKKKVSGIFSAQRPSGLVEKRFLTPFSSGLKGATILDARRRGKNIFLDLDNGFTLHTHLKMTGHFLFGQWRKGNGSTKHEIRSTKQKTKSKARKNIQIPWKGVLPAAVLDDPGNRFIRFLITFTDGSQLALSDMRRFARLALYPTHGLEEHREFGLLGPEPLATDFTPASLGTILASPTLRPIKQFLMDQTKIVGIGNIYADEMLFRAGISPRRRPNTLIKAEIKKLHAAMREVLLKGIDMGGDSDVDFRNIDGEKGSFQNTHRAYRLTGKPCTKRGCNGTIERIVLGQRSAHFCPEHQK